MEDALPGAFYTTPTSLKLAHLALRVSRANVRRPCASPRSRMPRVSSYAGVFIGEFDRDMHGLRGLAAQLLELACVLRRPPLVKLFMCRLPFAMLAYKSVVSFRCSLRTASFVMIEVEY
jgi:hypothetical protein